MRTLKGDCLDILKTLDADSCDALVTDPPAGISFMGKSWDGDKGGRDQWVAWLAEVMTECRRVLKPGAHALVWAIPRTSHWTALAVERSGFEIRDCIYHLHGQGFPKSRNLGDGMGSALKPAVECWWLARKPLGEKTLEANYKKWGTGAINLDGCRIGISPNDPNHRPGSNDRDNDPNSIFGVGNRRRGSLGTGRFPSNLVLDEEAAAALDEQSGVLKSGQLNPGHKQGQGRHTHEGGYVGGGTIAKAYGGDSGGASRFFYVAKASKSDRGEGNTHPTVKSTKLMAYLVRLVTPPGGMVLDPFMGSGSTGVAAQAESMHFLGIEKEPQYFDCANRRLQKAE